MFAVFVPWNNIIANNVPKRFPVPRQIGYISVYLGEGAYSSVYKAKRLIDNEIYAVKKVKLNNLNEREK